LLTKTVRTLSLPTKEIKSELKRIGNYIEVIWYEIAENYKIIKKFYQVIFIF